MKLPAILSPRAAAIATFAIALAGCATRVPAPVMERTPFAPLPAPAGIAAAVGAVAPESTVPTYIVKRGDTLRVIAQDKGIDYRELAAWNNLDNPNRLNVGQVLRLAPPGTAPNVLPVPGPTDVSGPGVVTTPLRVPPPVTAGAGTAPASGTAASAAGVAMPPDARNGENYKSSPKAIKLPYSADAQRDFGKAGVSVAPTPSTAGAPPVVAPHTEPAAPRAAPASPPLGGGDDQLDWVWPAKGKIIGTFSETANLKGIDIAGSAGTPVLASAAGKVVYAGSGLRGYGKLVIIKHNDTYLSAYAHNREIVVKEGDVVARGQKIAEMGSSDADQVKLHFEIRRLGKPMDPTKFLPPA
ncbi:MAG: peptidoglycan DD-metalloendopeptidase family protein [Casimicrobiaceae bacterium]